MPERSRTGQVPDAIAAYLEEKQADASVPEIHAAVAARLGRDVPASSVRSYLRLSAGELFERTGRGRYRLVSRP